MRQNVGESVLIRGVDGGTEQAQLEQVAADSDLAGAHRIRGDRADDFHHAGTTLNDDRPLLLQVDRDPKTLEVVLLDQVGIAARISPHVSSLLVFKLARAEVVYDAAMTALASVKLLHREQGCRPLYCHLCQAEKALKPALGLE